MFIASYPGGVYIQYILSFFVYVLALFLKVLNIYVLGVFYD